MFIVITYDNEGVDWNNKEDVLREEAEYIWNLQKNGILRNIWFTDPERDAVLLFESETKEKVQELTRYMPLVKNGLIGCRVMQLKAYDGYERLFSKEEIELKN